jgi:hypothetical protein
VACYVAGIHPTTNAWADPPSQFPPPIPTPPPIGNEISLQVRPQLHRVAIITLADHSVVLTRAAANKFQLVAARPGETTMVVVQIPVPTPAISGGTGTLANMSLANTAIVQPLDGGQLIQAASVPIVNGAAAFQFRVGAQPGLYRVLVMGPGPAATVQFWVQDPQRPATNPWVVNAGHWQ